MTSGAEQAAKAARAQRKDQPPKGRKPSLAWLLIKIAMRKDKLIMTTHTPITVEVKSAWASKINWKEAIAIGAMILAYVGVDLDAETQAALLAAIIGVSSVVGWVLRTWFTKAVTAASVK